MGMTEEPTPVTLLQADDPDIASWLLELIEIEESATNMGAEVLALGFRRFLDCYATGTLSGLPIEREQVRSSMLQAWRFE